MPIARKTQDQKILDPDIFIDQLPLEPWTKDLWTNNFIQQGLNRILGYDEVNKKWIRLKTDVDGFLKTHVIGYYHSTEPTIETVDGVKDIRVNNRKILMTSPSDHEFEDITVFSNDAIPATSAVTHTGIDISTFNRVTVLLSTTGSIGVYFQLSDDNTNWYDVKTFPDTDLTFNCNNEKIAIQLVPTGHYFRIVLNNAGASSLRATGVISGQS